MPNTRPAVPRPAEAHADRQPRARGDHALRHRARHRDPPDRDQLLDVELQADAEHQQDDADLGQLLGHVRGRRRSPACTGRRAARRRGSRRSARDRRDGSRNRRRGRRRDRRPGSGSDRSECIPDSFPDVRANFSDRPAATRAFRSRASSSVAGRRWGWRSRKRAQAFQRSRASSLPEGRSHSARSKWRMASTIQS